MLNKQQEIREQVVKMMEDFHDRTAKGQTISQEEQEIYKNLLKKVKKQC